jgi:hypothetical protein
LQFESLVFDGDGFDFEVDADGGDVAGFEEVFAEADEDVGFADAAVTDYDQFEGLFFLF